MLHIHELSYFDVSIICPDKFRSQNIVTFVIIPPCVVEQQYLWNIALQPLVGYNNVWANLRGSGCSSLGKKSLWNGTIDLYCQTRVFANVRWSFVATNAVAPFRRRRANSGYDGD